MEQGANVDIKDKTEVRMISEPWQVISIEVMWPKCRSGCRVGERQHCYAHHSSHLLRQGSHNCVGYVFS